MRTIHYLLSVCALLLLTTNSLASESVNTYTASTSARCSGVLIARTGVKRRDQMRAVQSRLTLIMNDQHPKPGAFRLEQKHQPTLLGTALETEDPQIPWRLEATSEAGQAFTGQLRSIKRLNENDDHLFFAIELTSDALMIGGLMACEIEKTPPHITDFSSRY